MSLTFSVIIVLFRLSNSNEIVALKACGVNLKELYRPILYLTAILTAFTFYSLMFLMPESNVSLKKQITDIVKRKITLNVSSESFITNFPGVTFYARKAYPKKGLLEDFMVSVKRKGEEAIIFARHGKIRREDDKVFLDISDGEGHFLKWGKPYSMKVLKFKNYTMLIYRFTQKERFTASKYKDLFQLLSSNDISSRVEVFKRLTLSITPLIMGMLAFAIGIVVPRGSIGLALTVSLAVILSYYVGYTVSKKLAQSLRFSPLPLSVDILFCALAYTLYRAGLKEHKGLILKW